MIFESLLPDSRRAALAIAEAIIPGSATVPAADEASLDGAEALIAEFHPTLLRAWKGRAPGARRVDARRPRAAVSTRSRPRSRRRCSSGGSANPIMRAPLWVIAMAHKLVHFDRTPVYEALGGTRNPPTQIEQPAWLRRCTAPPSGRRGHRVRRRRGRHRRGRRGRRQGAGGPRARGRLRGGGRALSPAIRSTAASVSAHRRFYRGAFTFGNVTVPLFIGRMFGGSTAIQRRHVLSHALVGGSSGGARISGPTTSR